MRIGVTLPTLSADAEAALQAARVAEEAGLHGVFSFDHLWPLGHPERPSLSVYPILGAVASSTARIRVGTLVARVGLLPDEVVAASIASLHSILGDRLIAGLGTGDEASEPEHERNGLPYLGLAARVQSLGAILEHLTRRGIECWIGAGNAATNEVAREAGVTLNFWDVAAERIAREVAAGSAPVTWAGPLPKGVDAAAEVLVAMREAGATWVVWGCPSSVGLVTAAAAKAGIELGEPSGGSRARE